MSATTAQISRPELGIRRSARNCTDSIKCPSVGVRRWRCWTCSRTGTMPTGEDGSAVSHRVRSPAMLGREGNDERTSRLRSAFNTAASSDNKIHDDTVARQFGFRGALVPGVEVYAYMAHMPVARWGRAWLENGQMDCRFLKPVYDGAVARVTSIEQNDELELCVESGGERCRMGHAFIPSDQRPAPGVDALPAGTCENQHSTCQTLSAKVFSIFQRRGRRFARPR